MQSGRPRLSAPCSDRRVRKVHITPNVKALANVRARRTWPWLATVALVAILPSCGPKLSGATLTGAYAAQLTPHIFFGKVDPEYACMYSRDPPRPEDRITASKEYRVHKKETNSRLKERCVEGMKKMTPHSLLRKNSMVSLLEDDDSSQDFMESPCPGRPLRGQGVASEWEDFAGRYAQLIPPPKKHFDSPVRSGLSNPDLQAALADVTDARRAAAPNGGTVVESWDGYGAPSSGTETSSSTDKPLVLMLDLDKCSFFGNDGE